MKRVAQVVARGPADLSPTAHLDALEAIAEHAHAMSLGPGVEGLARGMGITLARSSSLPAGVAVLGRDDGLVVVRRGGPRRTERLRALCELARMMLHDVPVHGLGRWHLALALAAPRSAVGLERDAVRIANRFELPVWAARMRVRILVDGA